jgi:squalene synthase HpnC
MAPAQSGDELRESYARCEALARSRLENFPVLSHHISPGHSHHLAAVYAYCRLADDAADESGSPALALAQLDGIRADLDAVFGEHRPRRPEFLALQATVRERGLSREPFEQLLDAFRQDQSKTRYATMAELLHYAERSANPVGRLVLAVTGELESGRDEKTRRSDAICTGLQLANFWQDVAADHAKGRIYIPAEAMDGAGVAETDVAASRCTPAFRQMMSSLCDATEPYFVEGAALADLVAPPMRIPILAFAIAGQELLQRIRAADFDIFSRRPSIGDLPLKRILAKAAAARFLGVFRPRIR